MKSENFAIKVEVFHLLDLSGAHISPAKLFRTRETTAPQIVVCWVSKLNLYQPPSASTQCYPKILYETPPSTYRHGRKHQLMPSLVNYRANIEALRLQGCTHVIATTACGSLRENIHPGDVVILDQFVSLSFECTIIIRRKPWYDLIWIIMLIVLLKNELYSIYPMCTMWM